MLKKINESSPILARFFVFVFVPVTISAIAGYAYLKKSLPIEEGSLQAAGLSANVSLTRDNDAVPHIVAASDEDAYFALGYAHAQDRLWQMEYQKLIAQGRLSEIRGSSTLKIDYYVRTLGLRQAADKALGQLSPKAKTLLDAYVKGVNASASSRKTLPIEFLLHDRQPEAWTALDSMLQLKLLQIGLHDASIEKMHQVSLVRQLGMAKATQLVQANGGEKIEVSDDFVAPDGVLVQTISSASARLASEFGIGDGDLASNVWAVSGNLTKSGKPMLANDLHSITQIPSKWYLSEIKGKEVHLAGASIPGLPLIFSGRNAKISWGTSTLRVQAPSLAMEKIHPLDESKYERGGAWQQITSRVETFQVRSAFPAYLRGEIKPIKMTVRSTDRGPVISDLADSTGATYSLELPGLADQDKTFDSLLALNFAQDWAQAKEGMRNYSSPAMNLVYADQQGNIASKMVGKLPFGAQVLNIQLPKASGTSGERFIAFDALPESLNPAEGFIVRSSSAAVQPSLGKAVDSREARLVQLLAEKASTKIDLPSMLAIQGDDASVGSAVVLKAMLNFTPKNESQEKASSILRTWDHRAEAKSVAATIYNAWVDRLFEAVVRDNTVNAGVSRKFLESYPAQAKVRFLTAVLQGQQNQWCAAAAPENACNEKLGRSLQVALEELQLLIGKNMDKWQWGEVYRASYQHLAIDSDSFFASFVNRKNASVGDSFSLNGGAPLHFSKDDGYQRFAGSSYRQVVDLSAENKSKFIVNTGQSGNMMSAHYDTWLSAAQGTNLLSMGFGEKLSGAKVLTLSK